MASPPKVSGKVLAKCARTDVTFEVLQYCLWMFEPVPSCRDPALTESLHSAKFTGAATSMRNLVEFLRNDRPTSKGRATDLVADHYFKNGWSRRTSPEIQYLYGATKRRHQRFSKHVNRHLSHLTTHRVTSRRKDRMFSWTDVDLDRVLEAFVMFVDDLRIEHPRRASWFDGACAVAKARLADMPEMLSDQTTAVVEEAATPHTITYVGTNNPPMVHVTNLMEFFDKSTS